MIREQSRFSINPLYVVACAICPLIGAITNLQNGILYSLITFAIAMLCINIISLVEKIANKNLRAFLITLMAGALVVVAQYVFDIIGAELLLSSSSNLVYVVISVAALSIVPTYFETRLTTKHYFINLLFSAFSFVVLTIVYSAIIEFLTLGSIYNIQLIENFSGFVYADEIFFKFLLVAVLTMISNVIYQRVEDRKMRFDLQVERYKLLIKKTLSDKARKEGAQNNG